MMDDKEFLICEGWLKKKCKHGPKGFKVWQKRFFRITNKIITYAKGSDTPVLGRIKPQSIHSMVLLSQKRMGARFDITAEDGRVYSLDTEQQAISMQWLNAFYQAVEMASSAVAGQGQTERIVDPSNFSQFQLLFFDAFFGADNMMQSSETKDDDERKKDMEKCIIEFIEARFKTDRDVLTYLLNHVLDPAKGHFKFDFSDDSFKDAVVEPEGIPKKKTYANSKIELSFCMSIVDMLDIMGGPLGFDVSDLAETFYTAGIGDMETLLDADVPDGIPEEIATILTEAVERLRSRRGIVAVSEEEGLKNVVDLVPTMEFARRLKLIFDEKDTPDHNLALRVVWAMYFGLHPPKKALSEFKTFVKVSLEGHLSVTAKDTLVALLLSTPVEVVQKLQNPTGISFNMQIKSAYMWEPFIQALAKSNMQTRKDALQDVATLLHENMTNATLLMRNPEWQFFFYDLVTDMSEEERKEEPTKTAYALTINGLTLVHYECFKADTQSFNSTIEGSISMLHHFAGQSDKGQKVGTSIFAALLAKLAYAKRLFPTVDQNNVTWQNLMNLSNFARRFVLTTAWWADDPFLGVQTADNDDDLNMEEFSAISTEHELVDEFPAIEMPIMYEHGQPRPESDGPIMDKVLTRGEQDLKLIWLCDEKTLNIKRYGLHWDDPNANGAQPCADMIIVDRMLLLFKSLKIDKFDANESAVGMEKDEAASGKVFFKLFEYWEDVKELLSLADRVHLLNGRYSYRRLSFMIKTFLSETTRAGRKKVTKSYADRVSKLVNSTKNAGLTAPVVPGGAHRLTGTA